MSGPSSFVTLFTNTMKLPLVGGVGSSATAADERPALTAFAALVRARETAAAKRTLSHVSWLPDVLRIRGSIIPDIIGPVLTVTLFGLAVAAGTRYFDLPLRLSNGVVPLLSVVVGLLLVFRNSAYERYSEGRKDFTLLLSASRNLSRLVWILVSLPPPPQQEGGKRVPGGPKEEMTREALTKEKIRFLKLVNAFVISVKHHLRGESGTDYQDYFGVLPSDFHRFDDLGSTFVSLNPNAFPPHANDKVAPPAAPATAKGDDNAELASLASSSSAPSPSELEGQISPHQKKKKKNAGEGGKKLAAGLKVAAHAIFPSNDIGKNERGGDGSRSDLDTNERTHLLHHHARKRTSAINVTYRPYESQGAPSLPLPLVIAHDLSRSIYRFRAQGTLDLAGPAGVNSMQNLIQMIDQMGAMERVVRTPLPPVFGVHLKQCVSLYLFSLPLVLVDDMGWLMIPIVTLVSFTLMGIEGIASQVEQPFGQDDNDLPLDVETAELRVEIEYMINRLPEGQDDDDVFAV